MRADIDRVMEDQVRLAAGRISYRDYGERLGEGRAECGNGVGALP